MFKTIYTRVRVITYTYHWDDQAVKVSLWHSYVIIYNYHYPHVPTSYRIWWSYALQLPYTSARKTAITILILYFNRRVKQYYYHRTRVDDRRVLTTVTAFARTAIYDVFLHTRSKDAREIIATDRTSKRTLISTDNIITMWCGTLRRRRRRLRWRRTKKVDHRLKTAVRERYVYYVHTRQYTYTNIFLS